MYSKGAELVPIKVTDNSAVIQVNVAPNCEEQAYQCRNRMGILKAIPTIFRLPDATIEHPKCRHKGDEYCEYHIHWLGSARNYRLLGSVLIFSLTFFLGLFIESGAVSLLFATGLASLFYTVLNFRSENRLRRALNEQVDAMKISINTVERQHQEAILISDIINLTNKMRPMPQLCDLVAELIHKKMKYDRVSIFVVDNKKNKIILSAAAGFDAQLQEQLAGIEFNLNPENNDGFLVKIVNTKEALFINNVEKQLDLLSKRSQKFVTSLGTK